MVCGKHLHLSQYERGLQSVSRGQKFAEQPTKYRIATTVEDGMALNV